MTAMSRTATAALGTMGTRIELRRRALEWSIEDTAARLGVNPRTVRAVELGRPTVKVGTVFAYADLVATCTDAITAEAHALRAHESAAWCPFEDLGPAAAGQQGCG